MNKPVRITISLLCRFLLPASVFLFLRQSCVSAAPTWCDSLDARQRAVATAVRNAFILPACTDRPLGNVLSDSLQCPCEVLRERLNGIPLQAGFYKNCLT